MLPLLFAMTISSSPISSAPSAQHLKVITHVKAIAACTTLRKVVGPAIKSIISNDRVIAVAPRLFAAYAKNANVPGDVNYTESDGPRSLQVERLEYTIAPLAKNVAKIETLVDRNDAFPANVTTAAGRRILALRASLKLVLSYQKRALNFISGAVDTENAAEMENGGSMMDFIPSMIPKNPRDNIGVTGANVLPGKIPIHATRRVTNLSELLPLIAAEEQRSAHLVFETVAVCPPPGK